MLTQSHLKLHSRAITILTCIDRCDYMIRGAKSYLNNNTRAPWFDCTKHIYVKQYHKYRAIKRRLIISYANVIEKIARPAMESNAKVLGNLVINANNIAEPSY